MRIAVLIIGLMLSAWMFLEGFILAFLDTNNALAADDADAAGLAGGGIVVAMIGALAAALAISYPLATTILLMLAGTISLGIAGAGYGNHWLYGIVLLVLAVLSFFGWRGKRKAGREMAAERQRQLERDERMESLIRDQRSQLGAAPGPLPVSGAAPARQNFCTSCGARNELGSRFCAECGTAIPQSAVP
jgi:hypothetical protein